MLTLIHGDDVVNSRKYFIGQREKMPDAIQLESQEVTITTLIQHIESGGLFSDAKTIFIENFLTKRKGDTDFKQIQDYLVKNAANAELFLWEQKEIKKLLLTKFPHVTIKSFKIPSRVFHFLDNIRPNNPSLLTLFHEAGNTTDDEMLFHLIIRQIRLLLGVTDTTAAIDEVKRLAPWQKQKLEKQARLFDLKQLIHIHKKLYEIDLDQKTGLLVMPLQKIIDFLLIEIYTPSLPE